MALKPKEMSTEIQNRDTSGPTKGHVSVKNFKKKLYTALLTEFRQDIYTNHLQISNLALTKRSLFPFGWKEPLDMNMKL